MAAIKTTPVSMGTVYTGTDITNPNTYATNGGIPITCPTTAPLLQGIFPSHGPNEGDGYMEKWSISCVPLPPGVVLKTDGNKWQTPATQHPELDKTYSCPNGTVATGIGMAHVAGPDGMYNSQFYTSLQCASLEKGTTDDANVKYSVKGIKDQIVPDATGSCPAGYVAKGVNFSHASGELANYQESMQMVCVRVIPATTTTTPTTTTTTVPSSSTDNTIWIVIGVCVGVILLVLVIWKSRR